jgi:hypothetical protein
MNTFWIDIKYVNILSGRLEQFKIKKNNPFVANLRCPICGDSEKNKYKARGYLFQDKTDMVYKCHNCGIVCSFSSFLKKIDIVLHDEYSVEVWKSRSEDIYYEPKPDITKIETPKFLKGNSPLRELKKISQLASYHPAKQYIVSRKIENPWHAKLFYCPKFGEWTNSIIPNKLKVTKDEPRLIIPLLKEDGTMFGYQGRSFNPKSTLRYITIMLEDRPKIFGLDTVKKDRKCYVFEGPIDSMFIPNSIAMVGADVSLDASFSNPVYIFDNEPRNKEIIKRLDLYIDKGYNIVIWDNTFKGKDINEMILNGADMEHIKIVIDRRTFNGLGAKVELMNWKKC